jgi:hypothetical protein
MIYPQFLEAYQSHLFTHHSYSKGDKKMKQPEFVQVYKTLISIFKIKNRKNSKRPVKETRLEINISELKIQVNFLAPELDAYDLRTLIFLLANVNMSKEMLEILEALEDNSELVKKLNFKLEPYQKGDFSKLIKYETNWSKLLSMSKLEYYTDNIKKLKQTLNFLQLSTVNLVIKKDEKTDETILDLTSNLLTFHNDKRNNKVILVFNPLFYAIIFRQIQLKSTINLKVFQELFDKNANMSVVYCTLCDKVDFGKEKEFSIRELEYLCYGNLTEDRMVKSKRKKFLLNTLKEIEKLSNNSFTIKIEKEKIKVKRTPDRKKIQQSKQPISQPPIHIHS